jgi:hypothetical protein
VFDDLDTGERIGAFGAAVDLPAGLGAVGLRIDVGDRGDARRGERRGIGRRVGAGAAVKGIVAGVAVEGVRTGVVLLAVAGLVGPIEDVVAVAALERVITLLCPSGRRWTTSR